MRRGGGADTEPAQVRGARFRDDPRNGLPHKTSLALVRENDLTAHEALRVGNMTRSAKAPSSEVQPLAAHLLVDRGDTLADPAAARRPTLAPAQGPLRLREPFSGRGQRSLHVTPP